MATRIEIEKMLKRQVENLAQNTIDQVGDEIARGAKVNFNSARWEVPADDPNVTVYNLSSFRWKNDKGTFYQERRKGERIIGTYTYRCMWTNECSCKRWLSILHYIY